jgi:hypothetical protein
MGRFEESKSNLLCVEGEVNLVFLQSRDRDIFVGNVRFIEGLGYWILGIYELILIFTNHLHFTLSGLPHALMWSELVLGGLEWS